jgi:hypothetical protein
MTRAPFILIDGRAYRWKDILELRRAQLAAAGAAEASQLALFSNLCTTTAARPPSARHPGAICNRACSKIRPLKQGRAAYEGRAPRGLFAVDGRASFARERKPRLGAVARCPCRLRLSR